MPLRFHNNATQRTFYCVLTRFRAPDFVDALRAVGKDGNLEVISVAQDTPPLEGDFIFPLLVTALTIEDAVDVAAHYALKTYPGILPDSIWIVESPPKYVKELPRKLRKEMAMETAAQDIADGVIGCSRSLPELDLISDIVVRVKTLPWIEFPKGTFPKKQFQFAN